VLGLDPRSRRDELMRDVSFIADVAVCRGGCVLARHWSSSPVCTRASTGRAHEQFLRRTDIRMRSRVRELSKAW